MVSVKVKVKVSVKGRVTCLTMVLCKHSSTLVVKHQNINLVVYG